MQNETKKQEANTELGGRVDSVVMPHGLTAENGAKGLLSGEFFEVVELECTACDQEDEGCEVCSGCGSYTYRVPISWTTIKDIYAMAVKNLAA